MSLLYFDNHLNQSFTITVTIHTASPTLWHDDIVLYRKYIDYHRQNKTIVFIILSSIKQAESHFYSTIVSNQVEWDPPHKVRESITAAWFGWAVNPLPLSAVW